MHMSGCVHGRMRFASRDGRSAAVFDPTATLPSSINRVFFFVAKTMRTAMPSLPLLLFVRSACLLRGAYAAGAPDAGLQATVTDKEACVGCRFVWAKTNAILDESAGYEAVKDAFERTCAHMPDVFYDSCDKMFENEDRLIQEYLDGKYPSSHTSPPDHFH